MSRLNSIDIKQERAKLLDRAEAIRLMAEDESRDMTEDETAEFNAILDDETGLLAKVNEQLAAAEAIEAKQRNLSAARAASNQLSEMRPQHSTTMTAVDDNPRVNLRLKPLRAFKGPNAMQDAYYCGMWVRQVLSNWRDPRATEVLRNVPGFSNQQVTTDDSLGGYTVPTPMAQSIIDIRQEVGVARQVVDIRPMTSMTLDIPKRASGVTVVYPAEAAAIDPSTMGWSTVPLSAKKRGCLVKLSNELNDDSIVDQMDHLAGEMAYAFAGAEDREFINGAGTAGDGSVDGLLSVTNLDNAGAWYTLAATNDAWSDFTLADFSNVIGMLPSQFHTGASWLMSRPFFHSTWEPLSAAVGGNTFINMATGAGRQILGYPINFTDELPGVTGVSTASAIFGNFRMGTVMGDRKMVSIQTSEHFSFNLDLIDIRGISRYDMVVHEPGTSTTVGSYVVMSTGPSA